MPAGCWVSNLVMEEIRAFIAIELSEEIKLFIAQLQDQLKTKNRAPVKWVEPENIHLTLKFLGNIKAAVTSDIIRAMEGAARGIPPLHLNIDKLGAFPDIQRVQIVWVGLTGELDKLKKLQSRIDKALVGLGFPGEKRPFSPHLTVARFRDRATPADRQGIGRLITDTGFQSRLDFNASSVHLMRSQLTREGPIYSRLGSVSLG